jgi:small subunit ribosomal protein S18
MARNPKTTKTGGGRHRVQRDAAAGRTRRRRPRICIFCAEHATWVDYKDVALLRRFISDRGRIKARGATGTCAQHQRDVATAIKTARELALLPYAVRLLQTERRGDRGRGRRGGGDGPPGEASSGPGSDSTSEPAQREAADGAAVAAVGEGSSSPD